MAFNPISIVHNYYDRGYYEKPILQNIYKWI